MDSSIDYQSTQPGAPVKKPFKGTHFSHAPIQGGVIRGALRGSSPDSSEGANAPGGDRRKAGRGLPAGVHVVRDGHVAHPNLAQRPHVSGVEGMKAVADLDGPERGLWKELFKVSYQAQLANGVDPIVAAAGAKNEAEHGLIDAGFDGVEASSFSPGNVMLWNDAPVSKSQDGLSK